MVVSGNHLKQINARKSIIEPFCDRTDFEGMSYGVSYAGYDIRIKQACCLIPGWFQLASTIERFQIPNNMVAVIHDKSTWARRGIFVQNTVAEPGWEGYLTLEITNNSPNKIIIPEGAPIAQMMFHMLSEPLTRVYDGKYQDQPDWPVEAIHGLPKK